MISINDVKEADAALQKIGGLPVAIRAEFALKSDGTIIATAATKQQFTKGVARALELSPVARCSITRLIIPD